MARSDTRFRQAHNDLLSRLGGMGGGTLLPSEVQMSTDLGVSRTVVRAVLARMAEVGLLSINGREKRLARATRTRDRLPLLTDYLSRDELEGLFLDWVLRFDVPAGTALNVTQLARQFNVPPYQLQEFLASLGQSGLVERRARGGWRLLGFTADFAVELSDFRLVLELDAIRTLIDLPPSHGFWSALKDMRAEHLELLARIGRDFHDFPPLDGRFHALINAHVTNRFISQFQKVIRLIFHYHYQWDKTMERHRNEGAIREHLVIMDAIEARDRLAAEAAARQHLTTSKETLLSSLRDHRLG